MNAKLRLTIFSFLVFAVISMNSSLAARVEYSAGHADIGLAYESGELELHYHFGSGAVLDGVPLGTDLEVDPSDYGVRVADVARVILGANVSFLDALAGDPLWRLPSSNTPGLPFLGIASKELDSNDFGSASIQLTGFSGPGGGEFALWQSDGFVTNVLWQTFGGLDGTDMLPMVIGGHDHFNYGFTAEGVYDLQLTAVANLVGGGSVTDTETFRFLVGDSTVVPEPTGFGLLAGSCIVMIGIRRRCRRL